MVRWPPSFGPIMKFFYRRLYMKRCVFCRFSANFRKKWANLRLPLNIQKQKVFQLQGASPPWPPDQGLCPWTPLGAPTPDPRYRLAHCALAMSPLCQLLNTPLLCCVLVWVNYFLAPPAASVAHICAFFACVACCVRYVFYVSCVKWKSCKLK